MILSVHIPKTAGVSLRNLLKAHYGAGFVLHYWQITDAWGRTLARVPASATCVHGHYPASLLSGQFPHATLITWVRDPVERVASSYYHRLRAPDWQHPVCAELHRRKLSLAEYAGLPLVENEMTHFFGGKRPEDFAFIGIVEDFDRSLAALQRLLGIRVAAPRRDNVNPSRRGECYDLDGATRAEIVRHNREDQALYEKCLRRWRDHSAALASPVPLERSPLGLTG